ncbi:MAG: ferrous iron transport protein A, partial [Deltaproteobacteria bacterium]|nr:ferrous iron transport protein A [Deltaproteobacteria bacterium]
EMNPDEEGHVEGLMCGSALEKGLSVLGIQENDRLKMLHRIPPMEYRAVLDGRHVHLSEGAAAKIWVTTAGRFMQLALAPTGRPLVVERLLGGRRSVGVLESLGLSPGKTITIQEVSPARVAGPYGPCQTVIFTSSGLRFYLRPDQARSILVRFPTQDEYENAPEPVMK